MFSSLRQAIGHMAAWESGPTMARQDWSGMPRPGKRYTTEEGMTLALHVSRFLYGGGLITRGSPADAAIRAWATQKGWSLDGKALDAVLALDRHLVECGLKPGRVEIEKRTRQPQGAEIWWLLEYVETDSGRVIKREWVRPDAALDSANGAQLG